MLTYIDEVDKSVSNTVNRVSDETERVAMASYLQSFAKSMRRYMKSYFPQLDWSTIPFNML